MNEAFGRRYPGFVDSGITGLVVPDSKVVNPTQELTSLERKIISSKDLPAIFNMDVQYAFQDALIRLGLLPVGEKAELSEEPIIHKYTYQDNDGSAIKTESAGQYFFEKVLGKHGILAYYLPPYSVTTEHKHNNPVAEAHFQVAGVSFSHHLGSPDTYLLPGMLSEVPDDTEHQNETGESPAFTIAIMKNVADVPRHLWHIPTNKFPKRIPKLG